MRHPPAIYDIFILSGNYHNLIFFFSYYTTPSDLSISKTTKLGTLFISSLCQYIVYSSGGEPTLNATGINSTVSSTSGVVDIDVYNLLVVDVL